MVSGEASAKTRVELIKLLVIWKDAIREEISARLVVVPVFGASELISPKESTTKADTTAEYSAAFYEGLSARCDTNEMYAYKDKEIIHF